MFWPQGSFSGGMKAQRKCHEYKMGCHSRVSLQEIRRLKLHLGKSLQILIFRIREQQQNCAARSLRMERLTVRDVSLSRPQGTNCPFPFLFHDKLPLPVRKLTPVSGLSSGKA